MDIFQNTKSDIKMKEILMFVELARTQNMRELSRKTGVGPGQISKLIKSLEHKTQMKLIERSPKGVRLAPEAKDSLSHFEKIYQQHLQFQQASVPETNSQVLNFAATSFLSTHVIPSVISQLNFDQEQFRFRVFELSPDEFTTVGLRSGFDFAIHVDTLNWPKTWYSEKMGNVRWGLYAKADHSLDGTVNQTEVLRFPFVYPAYWSGNGIQLGEDGCPVPYSKRIKGHETATAQAALQILAQTQQLAFLPDLLASSYIDLGLIKPLSVKGWKEVSKPLYFSVKNDLVKKSLFDRLSFAIQNVIEAQERL